jgi:hypothetical protein
LAIFEEGLPKTDPTIVSAINVCKGERPTQVSEHVALEALAINEPKTWNACFPWNFQHTNATLAILEEQAPMNKPSDSLRNQCLQRRATNSSVRTCCLGSIGHQRAQNLELVFLGISNTQMQFRPFLKKGSPKQTQRLSRQSNFTKESGQAKHEKMCPQKQ